MKVAAAARMVSRPSTAWMFGCSEGWVARAWHPRAGFGVPNVSSLGPTPSPSTSTVSVVHRMWRGIDRATTACVPPSSSRVPVGWFGQGQMHSSKATVCRRSRATGLLNHLFRIEFDRVPLVRPDVPIPL